ncbi:MAG: hypothetical protein GY859_32260, partial [Desulfobacterales bacterium]|nr:hypothetical protein [Desulfobacterales bacterium]
MTIHKRLENWLADFTALIYRKKYTALACALLLTLALASQIPNLKMDTRDESFFHADDPAMIAYNNFRDVFGQDDMFIIALKPRDGLTREFFATLSRLHHELEDAVPYLDDISSLVNGRVVRAEGDTLIVEDLMKQPPETGEALRRVHALIERQPLYENLLVSRDRTIVSILIRAEAVIESDEEEVLTGFEEG